MTTPISSMALVLTASFVGSFGACFLKSGSARIERLVPKTIVLSSGRTSERAHMERYGLPEESYVMMGDYVEFALLETRKHRFAAIHLNAQWAKMLKTGMAIHLADSGYAALILPLLANAGGVFFGKQYLESMVIQDLIDAARIDGASELGIFHKVMMPLALPGAATMGIFAFVASWNNFFNAFIMISSIEIPSFGLITLFDKKTADPQGISRAKPGFVKTVLLTRSGQLFLARLPRLDDACIRLFDHVRPGCDLLQASAGRVVVPHALQPFFGHFAQGFDLLQADIQDDFPDLI